MSARIAISYTISRGNIYYLSPICVTFHISAAESRTLGAVGLGVRTDVKIWPRPSVLCSLAASLPFGYFGSFLASTGSARSSLCYNKHQRYCHGLLVTR
jgi:hypothetical protein